MAKPKEKLTLYLPEEVVAETKEQALRLDRSQSWVFLTAWQIARETIQSLPATGDFIPQKHKT